MGKARGFLEIRKHKNDYRPVAERVRDFGEVELPMALAELRDQAARCMDCGVPFCHQGCPLGNLIPEWNDLVMQGRLAEAARSLHSTNNFPEITSRVCPAPCEASCVLNLEAPDPHAPAQSVPGYGGPVSIKNVERAIADHVFASDLAPRPAEHRSGRRVAIVGSGPAGLAAAQQLARRGHEVTVFEKADRPGGLLRYGIPDFKLDKGVLERRIEQLRGEGVRIETSVNVGVDVSPNELRARFDALVLAGGAERPRPLAVPGADLPGVHYAMEFLTQQNRRVAGGEVPEADAILATGKRVVVLGGGDTGSDCIGTAVRQGAASVLSLELLPRPPDRRAPNNPWPEWPLVLRTSSSHDEGGEREFGVMTQRVLAGDDGRVGAIVTVRVTPKQGRLEEIAGSERQLPCELLLLAMGFLGPVQGGLLQQLGCVLDARGNVATKAGQTSVAGVFAAGDMARGQSLVVSAIAEGRRVADAAHAWLEQRRASETTAAE